MIIMMRNEGKKFNVKSFFFLLWYIFFTFHLYINNSSDVVTVTRRNQWVTDFFLKCLVREVVRKDDKIESLRTGVCLIDYYHQELSAYSLYIFFFINDNISQPFILTNPSLFLYFFNRTPSSLSSNISTSCCNLFL